MNLWSPGMPLNPAIMKAASEQHATVVVPPPAGPPPAWAIAIALGTPVAVIIILLVWLFFAMRRPAKPAPPPRLCPDCMGWGNDRYADGAKCPTCGGSGLAP